MGDVKRGAIETEYAGCRFRSRLEARWAVFFDALHISWEYEPEGFNVNYRLSNKDGSFRYLPDFRLPDLKLWVEVKGLWTDEECLRFLDATASMVSRGDFLICGPFVGHAQNWPWHLSFHKGDVYMSTWMGTDEPEIIATDFGGDLVNVTDGKLHGPGIRDVLLRGAQDVRLPPTYRNALFAAQGARFEHGESGAA